MAPPCTVCVHPDREGIDADIAGGRSSLAQMSDRWGVSRSALLRHRDNHLSPALSTIIVERREAEEQSLADRIERLLREAEGMLKAAKATNSVPQALSAIREIRAVLELMGKASGELKDGPTVQVVNLAASPEWLQVRGAVLEALAPHPTARAAVTGRLLELEQ